MATFGISQQAYLTRCTVSALMDANSSFVPSDTFSKTPSHDLYTYQGEVPRDVVADQAVVSANGVPPHPFTFFWSVPRLRERRRVGRCG
jgi:hypothetical protein